MSSFSPLRLPGLLAALALVSAGLVVPSRGMGQAPPPPAAAAAALMARAQTAAKRGQTDQAFALAEQATASASPAQKPEYTMVREVLRQRATLAHLQSAHHSQQAGDRMQAVLDYRTALALEPTNTDARLGLLGVLPDKSPAPADPTQLRVQRSAAQVRLLPQPDLRSFHLHTDVRALVGVVASAYGLRAFVADTVPNPVRRLDLAQADFAQAMRALRQVADVDWVPLDATSIYVITPSQLAQVQPLALRTFYLPWVRDGITLNQIATALRTLLGIRNLEVEVPTRALAVRATPEQLDAAEQMLLDLHQASGEVVMEVRLLEVNRTAARLLGLNDPYNFTLFSLGPLLAQLSQNSNLQQNLLQLFQQGGLNAVLNSGQLGAGALSQVAQLSPLLQNPFVVFGGGITLMAISVPSLSGNLSTNTAETRTVESALLRASSGETADLKVGERFPIVNATFSPSFLSPAISKVLGNGSFIQPFPSFSYEDLGLEVKLTPQVGSADDIHLKVAVTVKGLAGSQNNGLPILTNRQLETELSLRNGEPALLGGLLNQQEVKTVSGLPGLSSFHGLSGIFSSHQNENDTDELVVTVTPHLVRAPGGDSVATWLPAGLGPASAAEGIAPLPIRGQGIRP